MQEVLQGTLTALYLQKYADDYTTTALAALVEKLTHLVHVSVSVPQALPVMIARLAQGGLDHVRELSLSLGYNNDNETNTTASFVAAALGCRGP